MVVVLFCMLRQGRCQVSFVHGIGFQIYCSCKAPAWCMCQNKSAPKSIEEVDDVSQHIFQCRTRQAKRSWCGCGALIANDLSLSSFSSTRKCCTVVHPAEHDLLVIARCVLNNDISLCNLHCRFCLQLAKCSGSDVCRSGVVPHIWCLPIDIQLKHNACQMNICSMRFSRCIHYDGLEISCDNIRMEQVYSRCSERELWRGDHVIRYAALFIEDHVSMLATVLDGRACENSILLSVELGSVVILCGQHEISSDCRT